MDNKSREKKLAKEKIALRDIRKEQYHLHAQNAFESGFNYLIAQFFEKKMTEKQFDEEFSSRNFPAKIYCFDSDYTLEDLQSFAKSLKDRSMILLSPDSESFDFRELVFGSLAQRKSFTSIILRCSIESATCLSKKYPTVFITRSEIKTKAPMLIRSAESQTVEVPFTVGKKKKLEKIYMVEGPDCSGKSTLIKNFSNRHDCSYIKFTQKFDGNILEDYEKQTRFLELNIENLSGSVLLDRFYPSEAVYSYRRTVKHEIINKAYLSSKISKELLNKMEVILLFPALEIIKERFLLRGDEITKIEELEELYHSYERLITTIPIFESGKENEKPVEVIKDILGFRATILQGVDIEENTEIVFGKPREKKKKERKERIKKDLTPEQIEERKSKRKAARKARRLARKAAKEKQQ